MLHELVEEELVGLGEVGAEAVVQDGDDLGQLDLLRLRPLGPCRGRAVHLARLTHHERDAALVDEVEAVVGQRGVSIQLERRLLLVERKLQLQEPSEAVELLQVRVGERQNLGQERIQPHVGAQGGAELVLDVEVELLEPVHRRGEVAVERGVVGRGLALLRRVEELAEGVDFGGRVDLGAFELVLEFVEVLGVRSLRDRGLLVVRLERPADLLLVVDEVEDERVGLAGAGPVEA